MHRTLLLLILGFTLAARGQSINQNPQDMYKHVYWQAYGDAQAQKWGAYGLDYVGRLNDSIPHAFAVGSWPIGGSRGSSLCLNRFPYDTATVYRFPCTDAVRCRFNDDSFPDYLLFDANRDSIMQIVFGTARIDSFVTRCALHYKGDKDPLFGALRYYVMDCDSDGYDDILFSNCYYGSDSTGYYYTGALFYLRGGPQMDTIPGQALIGTRNYGGLNKGFVGGTLLKGKFRDTRIAYMAEVRENIYQAASPNPGSIWGDSIHVYLYPLEHNFKLVPSDSVLLVWDNLHYDLVGNSISFFVSDVDGDGVDDICVMATDLQRGAQYNNGGLVMAFRGGKDSVVEPTYFFHSPFGGTAVFGQNVIDLGDVCGKGYHSILITDPQSDNESYESGAAYLYNIGKGYKDSCVGFANGTDFGGHFAAHAIAAGDLNGDSLNDFIIGSQEGGGDEMTGHVVVFAGNSSYATPEQDIAVREPLTPSSPVLSCYPNPLASNILYVRYDLGITTDVTLSLSDLLGRVVHTERAPGGGGLWRMRLATLPAGVYVCKASAGARTASEVVVLK